MTREAELTGVYAGMLALAEVGLGSILHGLRIPFSGSFLSLNQALFLTRIVKLNRARSGVRTLAFRVSTVTALLKTLSPAGKKLLPMLAIAAQGLLYSLANLVLGPNLAGCVVGGGMLALWGVFQPVAILILVYGVVLGQEQLVKMIAYYEKLLGGLVTLNAETLLRAVLAFAAFKAFLCMALCFAAWFAPVDEQRLLNQKLVKMGIKALPETSSGLASVSPWRGAMRDIARPFFVIPLTMTAVFFWFSEDALAPVLWGVFRPLAFGYLLYLGIRMFPVDTWVKKAGLGGTALGSALAWLKDETVKKDNRHD